MSGRAIAQVFVFANGMVAVLDQDNKQLGRYMGRWLEEKEGILRDAPADGSVEWHGYVPFKASCQVCGAIRFQELISVHTIDISRNHGMPSGSVMRNITYCDDKVECQAGATDLVKAELEDGVREG